MQRRWAVKSHEGLPLGQSREAMKSLKCVETEARIGAELDPTKCNYQLERQQICKMS